MIFAGGDLRMISVRRNRESVGGATLSYFRRSLWHGICADYRNHRPSFGWGEGRDQRIGVHGFRWRRSSHCFQRRNRGRMGTHFGPQFPQPRAATQGQDSGHSRQFSAAFPGLLRTPGGRRLPADLPSRREARCRPETGQTARVSVANSESTLKRLTAGQIQGRNIRPIWERRSRSFRQGHLSPKKLGNENAPRLAPGVTSDQVRQ